VKVEVVAAGKGTPTPVNVKKLELKSDEFCGHMDSLYDDVDRGFMRYISARARRKRRMTVELGINLFGKPAWELEDLEGDLPEGYSEKLILLGDKLRKRLHDAAYIFDLLVKNGWQAYGTLYDINFTKDISLRASKAELKKLGLEEYMDDLRKLEEEDL
jgi:hypothetical protein